MLVADENHEQEQYAIDLIREMQAGGSPVGDWTALAISLDHFVHSVYFARSDQNRGIQLADLIAFILNRRARISVRPGNPTSDAAIEKLFQDHINPQIRTFRSMWP